MSRLLTIGFTKKSAEEFFEKLKKNGVKRLVDIRINNTSQLAGFAKGKDLEYFLKEICNIEYIHIVDFAPTKELLSDYQNKRVDWTGYEKIFKDILIKRKISERYKISNFDNSCFLCSEHLPDQCHRRLLVEHLKGNDKNVEIIHIK
ncbi:hypothetical protein ES708_10452 [subsurface metagenome]